jgi:hypothetical protein
LPKKGSLGQLARCYQAPEELVRQAYLSSHVKRTTTPFSDGVMRDALLSAQPGDHLVVIGRKSSLGNNTQVTTTIRDLIDEHVHLSVVSYYLPPSSSYSTRTHEFNFDRDVHNYTVNTMSWLGKTLNAGGRDHRINFVMIRDPTISDFEFLGQTGANVYLSRRGAEYSESVLTPLMWHEQRAADGTYWGLMRDDDTVSRLHGWLSVDCGLKLPESRFERTWQTAQRCTRFFSLADGI